MKTMFLAAVLLLAATSLSHAQVVITLCVPTPGKNNCIPVNTTSPLPTKSN